MQIQFHGQYKNNLWKIRCGKKFILGPNLLSTAVNDGSLEATVFMVNKFQSLSLKLQKHFFLCLPQRPTPSTMPLRNHIC